jgi:hypothetical protein
MEFSRKLPDNLGIYIQEAITRLHESEAVFNFGAKQERDGRSFIQLAVEELLMLMYMSHTSCIQHALLYRVSQKKRYGNSTGCRAS